MKHLGGASFMQMHQFIKDNNLFRSSWMFSFIKLKIKRSLLNEKISFTLKQFYFRILRMIIDSICLFQDNTSSISRRIIFLEKLIFLMEKLVSDSFIKKSKWRISLDQGSKTLYSWFWMCDQGEINKNILKLRCWPLALIEVCN